MATRKVKFYDRMDWAQEQPLPDSLKILLFAILRHTHQNGHAEVFLTSLAFQVSLTPVELDAGLALFEEHGLIRPVEATEPGAVAYQVVHGAAMDPQQLTLDVHGILAAIENMDMLSNQQQLALEKLVLRHFDWVSSEIIATTQQLDNLVPRWAEETRRRVFKSLVKDGILRRTRLGRQAEPHRFTLHLPETVKSDRYVPTKRSKVTATLHETVKSDRYAPTKRSKVTATLPRNGQNTPLRSHETVKSDRYAPTKRSKVTATDQPHPYRKERKREREKVPPTPPPPPARARASERGMGRGTLKHPLSFPGCFR